MNECRAAFRPPKPTTTTASQSFCDVANPLPCSLPFDSERYNDVSLDEAALSDSFPLVNPFQFSSNWSLWKTCNNEEVSAAPCL